MTAALAVDPVDPSSAADVRITALRSLLAEKFPSPEIKPGGVVLTGWKALDDQGGLPRGKLTEITGSLCAGTLFLETVLRILDREKCFAALIDASNAFAPEDYPERTLGRLLWVLCANSKQAIQSADLLLRDGNLFLVILDLQMLTARDLRSIPASTWHRFRRIAEQSNMVFAVLTCAPMVEGAAVRMAVRSHWNLQAMRQPRARLMSQLDVQVFNRVSLHSLDRKTA